MLPISHSSSPLPAKRSTRGISAPKFDPSKTPTVSTRRKGRPKSNVNSSVSKTKKGPKSNAIRNKVKATERQDSIHVEDTDGGIVITMQAGTYEVFKKVLCTMYKSTQQTICGRKINFGTPLENTVAHTTTIRMQSNGVSYTMNLYHSQCRILANGPGTDQFYQDFIDIICFIRSQQKIGNIPIDDHVNEVLRQYLEEHLEEVESLDSAQASAGAIDHQNHSQVSSGEYQNSIVKPTTNQVVKTTANHNGPIVIEDLANVIKSPTPSAENSQANSLALQSADTDAAPDATPVQLSQQTTGKTSTPTPPPQPSHPPLGPDAPTQLSGATGSQVTSPLVSPRLHIPAPMGTHQLENGDSGINQSRKDEDQGKQTNDAPQRNRRGGTRKKTEDEMTPEQFQAQLKRREAALAKKEEAVKLQAATQEQLQRDYANSRAHILMLEDCIKELENDKRLLQQKLAATPRRDESSTNTPTPPYPPPPDPRYSAQCHDSKFDTLLHKVDLMGVEMKYRHEITDLKHQMMMNKVDELQRKPDTQFVASPPAFMPPYAMHNPFQHPLLPYQTIQASNFAPFQGLPFQQGVSHYVQQPTRLMQPPQTARPAERFIPNPPTTKAQTSSKRPPKPARQPDKSRSQKETGATNNPDSSSQMGQPDNTTPPSSNSAPSSPQNPFLGEARQTNHERNAQSTHL